jgi:hypothetical protein
MITVKTCFDHLGGKLGDLLFARMKELKWLRHKAESKSEYEVTKKGVEGLTKLGVDLSKLDK